MIENGDGPPFPAAPAIVLLVTASPPQIRIIKGDLPHPACSSGPVLDSVSPVRFTWCQAQYEIEAHDGDGYVLRSTSRATLETGPHRGDTMEAFLIGNCVAASR